MGGFGKVLFMHKPKALPAPVAWWRMESGALTADSSGNGNTLTNIGVAESATAWEGARSGEFVRASADYMEIADAALAANFPLKNGVADPTVTVCLAVRFATVPSAGAVQMLFAKYLVGSPGDRSLGFGVSSSPGSPVFYVGCGHTSGTTAEILYHASALSAGRWYHVALRYEHATRRLLMRVWDDAAGAALGADVDQILANPLWLNTQALRLGHRADATHYLDGLLDDVRVYNRALSVAQIDAIRGGAI